MLQAADGPLSRVALRSWSSDGVDPQPVRQYSLLDRSEELRPLIETVDHGTGFALVVLNTGLIHSAASLHTVHRGVPVGGMCNDFARHDGVGLDRLERRAAISVKRASCNAWPAPQWRDFSGPQHPCCPR